MNRHVRCAVTWNVSSRAVAGKHSATRDRHSLVEELAGCKPNSNRSMVGLVFISNRVKTRMVLQTDNMSNVRWVP